MEGEKKRKIENFTMLASLGEGAFGTVTAAYDKIKKRKVAIKSVNIMKTI